MRNKLGWLIILTMLLWLLVILLSWIVAAAWPELPVRSLISDSGLRWLVASLQTNLQHRSFVWLVLGIMALGALRQSGLGAVCLGLARGHWPDFRSRMGIYIVATEVAVVALAIALLTVPPHAPLLSVTGTLWPGCLEVGFVPMVCFLVLACSVTFGLMYRRRFSTAYVLSILCCGVRRYAWTLPVYLALAELCGSIAYVLNL